MTENIKKLTPYQHVRLRTTVYFGSTSLHTQKVLNFDFNTNQPVIVEDSWVPAVFTAYREIVDNCLDEIVAHGHGNRIDINYDSKTMTFEIADNGRGIPIDWDEEHKMYKATLALSELMAGRNFEDRQDTAGMNGIGASGVNFCSEFFHVEIHRDGKRFYQEFKEGNDVLGDALQVIKAKISDKANNTGTKIKFRLSKKVFSDLTLPESFIRSRVYEIALCNPLVHIYYNGERVKVKSNLDQALFSNKKTIKINIKEKNFKSDFWIVPEFVSSGDHYHSIVNNIPVFNGGVHIDAFKRLFYANMLVALEKESKSRKLTPNRTDISEGILVYNITRMVKPDFDSQSKTRLINEEVNSLLKKVLEDVDMYKEIIKKNREWIDKIYARCAERTQKKDQAEISKLAKKLGKSKVAGLMDATGLRRNNCILFLAEGLSAIAGISAVRDPEKHGGLGLSGKVLNVNGVHQLDVLNNAVLKDIMNSVGLTIGERANRHTMRYGKIYIAADMDPDGANITALLVNFFYTFWPELFDPTQEAVISVFMTPFIIAEKGKQRKYWYAHDYNTFKPENYSGWTITRAKGLGTLTEEDWQHAISSPVAIPVLDDGNIKGALDLIFNNKRADDRKEWISM